MPYSEMHSADILLVDDEFANVLLLQRVLEQGGFTRIRSVTDSREFFNALEREEPDLILLDLNMPHVSGFDIMEELERRSRPDTFVPVLVLTADNTVGTKQEALSVGAHDFLTKPFDVVEVLLRVKNLLRMRLLHCQIVTLNEMLECRVEARTKELKEAQVEILQRLGLATEYRDDDTGEHIRRVGDLSAAVAETLGCDPAVVDMIRVASPLHDIGKIGIGDEILLKPGKLTSEEYAVMQQHTLIGASILTGSRSRLLQLAEEIAMTHHERWDGTGYPHGLAGEDIPIAGRIVAVVDVFDALTSRRPYKEPWPVERAVEEIIRLRGSQFDPRVVDAFLSAVEREPKQRTLLAA